MNFDLSEDQRTIKSTAREFLAARYPLAEVRRLALDDERGFTDAQWDEMVELGWPEIAELGTVEMIVRGGGARLRAGADATPVDVGGRPAGRRAGRRPARSRGDRRAGVRRRVG